MGLQSLREHVREESLTGHRPCQSMEGRGGQSIVAKKRYAKKLVYWTQITIARRACISCARDLGEGSQRRQPDHPTNEGGNTP
ncbi:uncharacterized protein SEPMUDRAFT_93496 [Sphaerulina musiva SO2202]|uniref:Uncharacterized protein n=1 Tax=Sphaerulina musiva (strain SO2202) TaxID=692275 RepID=M3BSI9_SPHMS|nr:uncharacterized protein SEPMUDRAFT_93496 [Sphaerulina musiva SO2202]EMF09058.1 hypothetical protein SEPMUDRAFT_93496 [Sphaerulina musiva SO2202]